MMPANQAIISAVEDLPGETGATECGLTNSGKISTPVVDPCTQGQAVVPLEITVDHLTNAGGSGLAFVPDEYQDEPTRTRESVRTLLNLDFQALCSDHGDPILQGAKAAIAQVLA